MRLGAKVGIPSYRRHPPQGRASRSLEGSERCSLACGSRAGRRMVGRPHLASQVPYLHGPNPRTRKFRQRPWKSNANVKTMVGIGAVSEYVPKPLAAR
jgi:hypothetical protein